MPRRDTRSRFSLFRKIRLSEWLITVALVFCLVVVGSCSRSEPSQITAIRLDYAYYNPVSLVLKDQGWLESELAKDQIKVEWVLSLGSNKALQFLNSSSIDFGSTAGAAALIGRANGNPIKSIYVYSKPEWTALVTRADSKITKVADLKGKRVAATRGTDPYIFLLRALERSGLGERDIQLIQLQHPEGKIALERGEVDAWAGLDPYMAQTEIEKSSRLFFRDKSLNSYGILNVREDFAKQHPDYVKRVLEVYEQARQWSVAHPAELKQILVQKAKLTDAVAAKQLERTDLSNPIIGREQETTIEASGNVLIKSGVIKQSTNISQVVGELIDPQFAEKVAKK
ncbi:MAG: aliphatic sulfonate ABC transporter substrate-binding protein [Chroococcidiopsidaceae cyanobacterium CP_BM_RX_35]|nr:aliphatic sulfonate ABC transporter substrate-binding protein [Chroococcidiopsidaceae cyanobacterium CP_BM_RX_35]